MIIPRYRVILTCLCLLLFICFLGCEKDDTASLHLEVQMSPAIAAKVQQDGEYALLHIGDTPPHRYEIGVRQEFSVDFDTVRGLTVVWLEYRDSEDYVLCSGTDSVHIKAGENTAFITLACATIALQPEYGPVGTRVTVTGDGFGASEGIRIEFAAVEVPTQGEEETNDQGHFDGITFEVPGEEADGEATVRAIGTVSSIMAEATFRVASPFIQAEPESGLVGSLVAVTGDNFGENETIRIYFGGTGVFTEGPDRTDERGHFDAVTFTVPEGTQVGEGIVVQARGARSGRTAEDTFVVEPLPSAFIQLEPHSGYAGDTVNVEGQDFGARETVQIDFAGTIYAGRTDTQGGLNTDIRVPAGAPLGETDVLATGRESARTASDSFDVLQFERRPEPAIQLDPTVGCRGTEVVLSGRDFDANEEVHIIFGLTEVGTTRADDQGGLDDVVFRVPADALIGETAVQASGVESRSFVAATFIVLDPSILLDPIAGCRGGEVAVTLRDFPAGETIEIDFGGRQVGRTSAGRMTFSVPDNAEFGETFVNATGSDSGCGARVPFTVREPTVELTPTTGCPDTQITLVGQDFGAGENISVYFGETEIIDRRPIIANSEGYFDRIFSVPEDARAGETFMVGATGARTGCSSEAPFAVLSPSIQLAPTVGCPGTEVTIVRQGFAEGERVRIDFEGTQADIIEPSEGSDTFTVPGSARMNENTITGVGLSSGCTAIALFTVIQPTVQLEPNTICRGAEGSGSIEATLICRNFPAGETPEIDFGGMDTINNELNDGTNQANDEGYFDRSFTIPDDISLSEEVTVRVTGLSSGCHAETTLTVIEPIIQLRPASGCPGSRVTVMAQGYDVEENIEIDFGGTQVEVGTDAQGNRFFFVPGDLQLSEVPDMEQITETVRATGTTYGCVATASFTVVEPTIQLDPDHGCPGTQVALTCDGFFAGESVEVDLGGHRSRGYIDARGNVGPGPFSIPEDATADGMSVSVTGSRSRCSARASFTVLEPFAQLDSRAGCRGAEVTVIEQNFGTGEGAEIYFNGRLITDTRVDDQGRRVFLVPEDAPPRQSVVRIQDPESGCYVETSFTVLEPAILLEPSRGCRGTRVTLIARNFSEDEDIHVSFGERQIDEPWMEAQTDAQGTFRTMTFRVSNDDPFGEIRVDAWGETSACAASSSFTVMAPTIELSRSNGCVDTELALTGQYFGAEEDFHIYFGEMEIVSDEPNRTDRLGYFDKRFAVPEFRTVGGETTVTVFVSGETSRCEADARFTVISPSIELASDARCRGSQVTLMGQHFGAGNDVQIYMMAPGWMGTIGLVRTGPLGDFERSLLVSGDAPLGENTVRASILSLNCSVEASFTVIESTIQLNPTRGCSGSSDYPGIEVTVTGDDFDAGEQVRVYFGRVDVTANDGSAVTDGRRHLETRFRVPPGFTLGETTVRVIGSISGCAAEADFTVTEPDIQLYPIRGCSGSDNYPGIEVTLSGDNFAANEEIRVYFDETLIATDDEREFVDGQGHFDTHFRIPQGLSLGRKVVQVIGSVSGCSAETPFTITEPTVRLEPSIGCDRTEVAVTGKNFGPSEDVQIRFGERQIIFHTDELGSIIPATFTVLGDDPLGKTSVVATGSTSGCAARTPFTVLAPTIQLDRVVGCSGVEVTVAGQNFSAHGGIQIGMVFEGIRPMVGIRADSAGSFEGAFTISEHIPSGGTFVRATDLTSGCFAEMPFTVIAPTIQLDPTGGCSGADGDDYPGIEVTLVGDGFVANEEVQVYFDGALLDTDREQEFADDEGHFDTHFTVPHGLTPGGRRVRVIGSVSECAAEADFTVTEPDIRLNPSIGCSGIGDDVEFALDVIGNVDEGEFVYPGIEVTLVGDGFAVDEEIRVYFDETPVATDNEPELANGLGHFDTHFRVPSGFAPGVWVVRVIGSTSGCAAEADFTVTEPDIRLSPSIGCGGIGDGVEFALDVIGNVDEGGFVYPGIEVTLVGDGFAVDEEIRVYFHETPVATDNEPELANGLGHFDTHFRVPSGSAPGVWVVRVIGSTSGCAAEADFTVIEPDIQLNPIRGCSGSDNYAGIEVTLVGNGFSANEEVSVSFDGRQIATDREQEFTDEDGFFTTHFRVPPGLSLGGKPVRVIGSESGCAAEATFTVAAPAIQLDPDSGWRADIERELPGTEVTVTGQGFGVGENVQIYMSLDGLKRISIARVATTRADPQGDIESTFTVPGDADFGRAFVWATGETSGCTAETSFDVLMPVE